MGLFLCVEQKALLVRKEVSDEDPEVRKVVKVNDSNIQNSCIIKATTDNLKLDKDEKNNGIKHDNKRNLVKQNWQGLNFEPAK